MVDNHINQNTVLDVNERNVEGMIGDPTSTPYEPFEALRVYIMNCHDPFPFESIEGLATVKTNIRLHLPRSRHAIPPTTFLIACPVQ